MLLTNVRAVSLKPSWSISLELAALIAGPTVKFDFVDALKFMA